MHLDIIVYIMVYIYILIKYSFLASKLEVQFLPNANTMCSKQSFQYFIVRVSQMDY